MSRHAEPRTDDELADVAAGMPSIPEDRVDAWDPKPWLLEELGPVGEEPEAVADGHP